MHAATSDIYLDANATTPTLPNAVDAACWTMQEQYGNPSSSHCAGLRARAMMETTREHARKVLGGAASGRILFTSGATEAIQTAVLSALSAHAGKRFSNLGGAAPARNLLLYGATEHKAVPESMRHWNQILHTDCEMVAIPVDEQGQHDLTFLAAHADRAVLVSTMAVNNETGVISNLPAIEAIMRQHPEALWLVDGVQALGKQSIELAKTRIDYFPLSGHKLYAPKGIGMLYVREGAPFTPLTAGGGQESGLRSGTENMAGIAGFGVILAELIEPTGLFCALAALDRYRDQLAAALREAFPGVVFNTPFAHSVATTINFSVPGFASKELLDLFDAAGIRVSSGSACGAGKATRSYVLDAMGLAAWRSESAVRLSFGRAWNDAECAAACKRIVESGSALRNACLFTEVAAHRNDFDGVLQMKHDGACTWLVIERAAALCVVIDPIAELGERIERYIRCQDLRLVAVLDTHSHADHCSSRDELMAHLGAHLLDPHSSADALGWPVTKDLAPIEALHMGHYSLSRLTIPGHTEDSVAYLLADERTPNQLRQVFIGDTVLSGGIGRSNFASSSAAEMYHSLRKLAATIGADTLLCAAHDYNNEFATTLAIEARSNVLLASVLADPPIASSEFVAAKQRVDATLNDATGSIMMCGALRAGNDPQSASVELTPLGLRQYLQQHPDATLVDVREAYECALGASLALLDDQHALAVPLSRLADAAPTWLAAPDKPLVFFCRSGNRSALATRCLRRLGHPNAFHLRGGLALFD